MERHWLIVAGAILGVLLISTLAALLTRGEAEFAAGSPEYAFQQYVKLLVREDYDSAKAMWSVGLREQCSFDEFLPVARREVGEYREGRVRVLLEDVDPPPERHMENDGTSLITLRVTRVNRPFGFWPYISRDRLHLFRAVSDGGRWLVDGHTWPPYDSCMYHYAGLQSGYD